MDDDSDYQSDRESEMKEKINNEFINKLSIDTIRELSLYFKQSSIVNRVSHKKFIEALNEIFGSNYRYDELYESIFQRFKTSKFSIINQKDNYFISNMVGLEEINSYEICCALICFIKCEYEEKLKLLFEMTDIDEDGYLNEKEINRLMTTLNVIFSEEEKPFNSDSAILHQSLANMKNNDALNALFYYPGELKEIIRKEIYVNFDTFYSCLTKIPDYKYKIPPFYVNFEKCLLQRKQEKKIKVQKNLRNEFLKVSSEIISSVRLTEPKPTDFKIKFPSRRTKKFIMSNNNCKDNSNTSHNCIITKKISNNNSKKLIFDRVERKTSKNNGLNQVTADSSHDRNTLSNTSLNEIHDKRFSAIPSIVKTEDILKGISSKLNALSNTNLNDHGKKFSVMQNIAKTEGNIIKGFGSKINSPFKSYPNDKNKYGVNVNKIRNMEIHPCVIDFFDNPLQTVPNEDSTYRRRKDLFKNKNYQKYLSNNEILTEINVLSNKNRGDYVNEGEMNQILDDLKGDSDEIRRKIKEKDKYGNRLLFGKADDLKVILKK